MTRLQEAPPSGPLDPDQDGDSWSNRWVISFWFQPLGHYMESTPHRMAARAIDAFWILHYDAKSDGLCVSEQGTRAEAVSDACQRVAPLLGELALVPALHGVQAVHIGEAELGLLLEGRVYGYDVTREARICLGIEILEDN